MKQDAAIRCQCGKVTGTINKLSAASTNHVVCACDACQAYAHYLGRSDDMLDERGGTNIFQMDPKHFHIETGFSHIETMSVTDKGPLRWYASCCKTPLGNSFRRGGTPFLGVLPICTGIKGTSDELVSLVGPVRGEVNMKTKPSFPARLKNGFMLMRFLWKLLWWRIIGGKSVGSFFNPKTMMPIRRPIKITEDDREALYLKVIR
jgi:hypothetical protein